MYKKLAAIALFGTALVGSVALASDPIAAGDVTNLTYRSNYILFQVVNNGVNSCANCPADPAGLGNGGYCWVATTQTAEIAIILAAQSQNSLVSGRVNALATDCTVYQMTVT